LQPGAGNTSTHHPLSNPQAAVSLQWAGVRFIKLSFFVTDVTIRTNKLECLSMFFFASFFLSVQAAMAGLEPLTLQVFYHSATVAGLRILQSIKILVIQLFYGCKLRP
jgi:hypothetical protein